MPLPAWALLAVLLPHPDSYSFSELTVRGAEVRHRLRLQALSLSEVVHVDTDGDGLLSNPELEAAREQVEAYLLGHYTLRVDTGGDPDGGRPLEGRLAALTGAPPEHLFQGQWLEAELRYEAGAPLEDLLIEVTTFYETSPGHYDAAELDWNGHGRLRQVFSAFDSYRYFAADQLPAPPRLSSWLATGARSAAAALEALGFLAAVLLACTTRRQAAAAAAVFAAAQAVTLALSATGLVVPPERLVGLVTALSVAYVAAGNLMFAKPRGLALETALFGLVHGLALAALLGAELGEEAELGSMAGRWTVLAGFGAGAAGAQLALALVGVAVLGLLPGDRRGPEASPPWLAPRRLRLGASGVLMGLGLLRFTLRAWF